MNEETRPSQNKTLGENILEFVRFVFIVLIIVVPIRAFVAQPFIVSGHSMDPTFADGEYLIVDEISYRFHAPARGDVIVFRPPQDENRFYIKRVIGLPGETVTIEGATVIIQNESGDESFPLEEPYIQKPGRDGKRSWTLKNDEYFVMGDNRRESSDSRSWGALPEHEIVGRAYLRLLPLRSIDILPGKYNFSL